MLKNYKKNKSKYFLALLILIIILGSFLRLYKISLFNFADDQARDVQMVKRLIIDHKPIWEGPEFSVTTPVGKGHLGPFYFYLIAPTYLLWDGSPMGNVLLVAIINIVAIYFMYLVGKRYFNKNVGMISAFFLAISNYMLYFSRTPWNQNILILLLLLMLWSLKKYYEKQENYLILFSLFFAFALQSHASAFLLMPAIILIFAFKLINLPKIKIFLCSIAVFVLAFLPLIIYDLFHNFINFKAYIYLALGKGITPGGYIPNGVLPFWESFKGFFSHFFAYNINNNYLSIILLFLIIIGFALILIKGNKLQKIISIFGLFLLFMIMRYAYKNPIQTYFFLIMVPFILLSISYIFNKLIEYKKYFWILISTVLIIFSIKSIKIFKEEMNQKINRTYNASHASDTLWPDMENASRYIAQYAQENQGGKDKTFEINFQTCPSTPFVNFNAFKYTLSLNDATPADEEKDLMFYIIQPDTSINCAIIDKKSFNIIDQKQFGKVLILVCQRKN